MAKPKPSSDYHPNPAAAAPVTARRRRARAPMTIHVAGFILLVVNLAACVGRRGVGDCGAFAFAAAAGLALLLLFWSLHRLEESAYRGRAKLAAWAVTLSLSAAVTWWMMALPVPLRFAAPVWVVVVAVAAGLYVLFTS